MLRTAEIKTATRTCSSPRPLIAALLPVLALLLALVPASATAADQTASKAEIEGVSASARDDGTGSGSVSARERVSSETCTASVSTANSSSLTASITVECEDDDIDSVVITTNERNEGRLEGQGGTTCTAETEPAREFTCTPGDDGSISAEFTEAQGEAVCLRPVLAADFAVTLDDGTVEEIEDVDASGCDDSDTGDDGAGGGEDEGGGEDDGSFPEGGVDSGWTAKSSSRPGAELPIAAAMLTALALGAAGRIVRRNRAAR